MKLEITNYGLESVMNGNKILLVQGAFVQFSQSLKKDIQGDFLVLWVINKLYLIDIDHMLARC